jgi:predicted PurR-regulated permease PerM
MSLSRVVEYVFFFALLAGSGYMVWQVLSPFVSALALSLIIVTITYPLYTLVESYVYKNSSTLAAAITTLLVLFLVIIPIFFISSIFARELVSFYQTVSTGQELPFEHSLGSIEEKIQLYIPEFQLNLTQQLRDSSEWIVRNIGIIFAGTISTIFMVVISLIGSFYFFKDGRQFLRILIKISPLPDSEDEVILSRLAKATRSVVTGVVFVSIVQGILAAVGFTIFGIDRAVLWGAVAAILSMIPGVGTLAIMIPGIIYLFVSGTFFSAIGLTIWTIMVIILIDNMLGPYLMSRGNNLHPFIILISVLGGISMFGPIGFIVGPVIVTLFMVLLEIYNQYIVKDKKVRK